MDLELISFINFKGIPEGNKKSKNKPGFSLFINR